MWTAVNRCLDKHFVDYVKPNTLIEIKPLASEEEEEFGLIPRSPS